jgi:hypothetical protein
MIECPFCHSKFPEAIAAREAFEAFHAIRDEYAVAQGLTKVDAKDTLCVMYGVSEEVGDDFLSKLPKWPGVFCRPLAFRGRIFYRKSTLAYSPAEMHQLIEASAEAAGVKR